MTEPKNRKYKVGDRIRVIDSNSYCGLARSELIISSLEEDEEYGNYYLAMMIDPRDEDFGVEYDVSEDEIELIEDGLTEYEKICEKINNLININKTVNLNGTK